MGNACIWFGLKSSTWGIPFRARNLQSLRTNPPRPHLRHPTSHTQMPQQLPHPAHLPRRPLQLPAAASASVTTAAASAVEAKSAPQLQRLTSPASATATLVASATNSRCICKICCAFWPQEDEPENLVERVHTFGITRLAESHLSSQEQMERPPRSRFAITTMRRVYRGWATYRSALICERLAFKVPPIPCRGSQKYALNLEHAQADTAPCLCPLHLGIVACGGWTRRSSTRTHNRNPTNMFHGDRRDPKSSVFVRIPVKR